MPQLLQIRPLLNVVVQKNGDVSRGYIAKPVAGRGFLKRTKRRENRGSLVKDSCYLKIDPGCM
jgi:hypothetical protein